MADLREIVGAHQPDEKLAREKRLQRRERVRGVMRAKPRLDIKHADAWVVGERGGLLQPLSERCHADDGLQRILRRDQPPDLVEAKPLEGFEADMTMAFMRRVEGSAQEPDPPLRRMAEHRSVEALRVLPQGRTWPVPRTTYL